MKFSLLAALTLYSFQFSLAQPMVKHAGSMSQMGKENFKSSIRLDTVNSSHLYGIGPYGRMQGEITVLDGRPLIAQVLADGTATVSLNWQAEAPFFAYANVSNWTSYPIHSQIENINELQRAIEDLAVQKGYDLSTPFPFRIMGTFTALTTHVVTPRSEGVAGYRPGRNQENYSLSMEKGELLGFYSQGHQGIYTQKDSYIHVHFVSSDKTQMGHVDKIALANGPLTLLLPARSKPTGSIKLKTNDTDFSKGRLGNIQEITLDDVAKFHGHLCDGLVVGFLGLREALYKLYPDSIIDRTNTRIVSNPSPCLTDVGIYLTGGRYQFNSFYVDDKMKGIFTVARIDNGQTYQVMLKPGVKPDAIDSLGAVAMKGQLSACDLDGLRKLEDQFTDKLLSMEVKDIFEIIPRSDFRWSPILKNSFIKTDILNRGKAICK